jgi:hypothetical protein
MALDRAAGDSLFGNIKKKPALQSDTTAEIVSSNEHPEKIRAKWQTFDKISVLLTPEQKEGLDRLARKLMKSRPKGAGERITANMLVRSLIENFLALEDSLKLEALKSEDEVQDWMKRMLSLIKEITHG